MLGIGIAISPSFGIRAAPLSGTKITVAGDSITAGLGVPKSWAQLVVESMQADGLDVTYANYAANSVAMLADPGGIYPKPLSDATRTSVIDAAYDPTKARNVYCVMIGTNDINDRAAGVSTVTNTQVVASLKSHMQARKALGYVTVVCTILPFTTGFTSDQAQVDDLNTKILADTTIADYFVPVHLEPALGDSRNKSNITMFQDSIHPTTVGHTQIAQIVKPILVSAMNGRTRPVWTTIFSTANDGGIYTSSGNASYATVRSGGGTMSTTVGFGSLNWGLSGGLYNVAVSLMNFDTSTLAALGTPIGVAFGGKGLGTVDNTQNKTIKFAVNDFGSTITTGDFVPGANLAALPQLASHPMSSAWNVNGHNYFVSDANAPSRLNTGSATRVIGYLDGLESATGPTGLNSCNLLMSAYGTDGAKMLVVCQP